MQYSISKITIGTSGLHIATDVRKMNYFQQIGNRLVLIKDENSKEVFQKNHNVWASTPSRTTEFKEMNYVFYVATLDDVPKDKVIVECRHIAALVCGWIIKEQEGTNEVLRKLLFTLLFPHSGQTEVTREELLKNSLPETI